MRFDPLAMLESFSMANMSPQLPAFNRGVWKRLEECVRTLAVREGSLAVVNELLANCRAHAAHGRVVVFDTETTGISNADEIVQIAEMRRRNLFRSEPRRRRPEGRASGRAEYVDGKRTRTLNLYVVPTCEIDPGAEAVHHLSREFLEENGIKPTDALSQFFEFLGNGALLVGHNIHFDFRMLQNECRKFEFCAEPEGISFCDTIALAKKLVPGMAHYNLGVLIKALNLAGENSHDALDDTLGLRLSPRASRSALKSASAFSAGTACGSLFFDLVRRIPVPGEYTYEPVCE